MERRTSLRTTTLATGSLITRLGQTPQNDKIKIGIIGTGWWGRDFLTHYALQSNEFEIIGICDVTKKQLSWS